MQISNITFDEINVGDSTTYTRLITNQEIEAFAAISGDHNPLHLDPDYAATTSFGECIAHGMLTGALISAAIAMQLPGPGSVYLSQSLQFKAPVFLGDSLTVTLSVIDKHVKRPWITLQCQVENQDGKAVAKGEAQVAAPTTQETVTVIPPPALQLIEAASLSEED
ncbi:MaoC family dehydratase [bacterium]|nr:MaoC family dehydratase [bacterium]